MAQSAPPKATRDVGHEYSLGGSSPAAPVAEQLFGAGRRIERSEARGRQNTSLWVTSLQRPGVIEVVPTENISSSGMQMVTHEFWKPDELVLVSSPGGFCVQGSVVDCKKLPSQNYTVCIRLDAPVEHWTEALGFAKF